MKIKIFYVFALFFVLTACSSQNEFSITLLDENNSEYNVISNLSYNEEITLPRVEKEGHLFIGWAKDDNIYFPQLKVTKNISLTPVFEKYSDVFSYDFIEDSSSHIIINQYTGQAKYLYLPTTIDGYTVTSIQSLAFKDSYIVNLYLHEFISSLKPRAFLETPSLENIFVSEDHESLDDDSGVLIGSNHTLIHYPQGKKDTTYTLPDSITTIAPYAFMGQRFLETINLSQSLTYIGYYAFSQTLNISSLIIPSSVLFIDSFFTEDSSIETVILQRSYEDHGSITNTKDHDMQDLPNFYVPDDSLSHYQEDHQWQFYYSNIKPQSNLN